MHRWEKRRNTVSGHSVSAADEKIIGPLAGRGSASPNGHHPRAPAVIAENASDSITSTPRSPGRTSPGGLAGNNWDAEKPAPTRDVSRPSVPARTPGSTDSRGSDVIGSAGRSDNGVGEGAERAVLLATKPHVPAIGGPARSPGRPARRPIGGTTPQADATECARGLGQDDITGAVGFGCG
jgi:LuxR family transcriptional regulator, maltose regulon positive regulatory protein